MKKIITNSEKETFAFAKKYANSLKGGEIIGLIGDLGAGKTIFSKGIAKGLGITQVVNSPTFVLMKIYEIKNKKTKIKKLCHIDVYRIKNEQDIAAIGAEEYFNDKTCVTIIEWADRIKKILPKKSKIININHGDKEERIINIK